MHTLRARLAAASLVLAGIVTAAVDAPADPVHALATGPGPGVTSLKLTSPTSNYVGGPLSFAATVFNDNNYDAPQTRVVFAAPGTGFILQTIDLKGSEQKTLTFVDSVGLLNLCSPKDDAVAVERTGLGNPTLTVRTTPTCTFATKVEYPWNLAKPDTVEYQKQGHVWLQMPVIEKKPTCSAVLDVKVMVVSWATAHGKELRLQLVDAKSNVVATRAAFDLAPSSSKTLALAAPLGATGKLSVAIADPKNSLAGKTATGWAAIDVTPSCTLATTVTAGH